MIEDILNRVRTLCKAENVSTNSPLKDYTTFKVGGPAKIMVKVLDVDTLSKLVVLLEEESIPYFIIGNGSNLLVSDDGFDGLVIKLEGDFLKVSVDGDVVKAGSGAVLGSVCKKAYDASLTGLEFAYGIPGTIGGAIVMNAGAYDGEMKDIVTKVCVVSKAGEILELSNEEMQFVYRNSIVRREGYIVTGVTMKLEEGKQEEIKAKMDDLLGRRVSKQPLEFPSAGSTFKRPQGHFAGKLIMEAGLSGYRVGGACVSPKHCGFVVNDQGASASDIDKLMKDVTAKVLKNTGITLEAEVIRIGNF